MTAPRTRAKSEPRFRIWINYGRGAIGSTVPLPLDKAEWLLARLQKRGQKVSMKHCPQPTSRARKIVD